MREAGSLIIPLKNRAQLSNSAVIAGLVPAIHAFKSWTPGTNPGMTNGNRGPVSYSAATGDAFFSSARRFSVAA